MELEVKNGIEVAVKCYFADQAWINGAWASDVLLSVDRDGLWCGVEVDVPAGLRRNAMRLPGSVLPGLVNAHSHAFQRAIAGLTECRKTVVTAPVDDDFWSWRERMYSAANRISPGQLEAIATFLYAELLMGGYTHVCEFHYLHNGTDGKPYADSLEMSHALVRAAQNVGIGLTLLPTLYMRSGFGASGLRQEQRRFASTPDSVLRILEGIATEGNLVGAGVAVHSLRAADINAINEVSQAVKSKNTAIHIHIAEQIQEVDDCLAHHGQRPVALLLDRVDVSRHWNLVHATHTNLIELAAIQQSGASIVICPGTEANLGDGVFDYPGFGDLKGNWSIGSDSHASRSWVEELRLLEYSQRLTLRKRNIAARVAGCDSSAAALFNAALAGGRPATSLPVGGIAIGNRADFLVIDKDAPALLGIPPAQLLDAMVFSSPGSGFSQVFVAGRQVVNAGELTGSQTATHQGPHLAENFRRAMKELWS